MTTFAEAIEDVKALTTKALREAAVVAEAQAARILAELYAEPAYELPGRLKGAAELIRARDTFLRRANQIENFGSTTDDEDIVG